MMRPTVETAMGSALARAAKEQVRAEMRTRADSAVQALIDACDLTQRGYLAVALLERAAEAVSAHHDGPRTQSHLGRVAARHGADLPGVRGARAEAEKLFRRRGQ